jgi:hypothetical protein
LGRRRHGGLFVLISYVNIALRRIGAKIKGEAVGFALSVISMIRLSKIWISSQIPLLPDVCGGGESSMTERKGPAHYGRFKRSTYTSKGGDLRLGEITIERKLACVREGRTTIHVLKQNMPQTPARCKFVQQ